MWKPIAESEMRVVLDEEIARLDELSRPTWKKYKVKLQQLPCEREGYERESIYIVARHENQVVLFDDRKEQFGVGKLEEDGVIRKWSLYGEKLGWALRHFPWGHKPPAAEE